MSLLWTTAVETVGPPGHDDEVTTADPGTVYLLHFDRPFKHAMHYMGWASDLEGRLRHHQNGTGANLLKHVRDAGIGWTLARTWVGDRHRERALKVQGGHSRKCPMCLSAAREGKPLPPDEATVAE